MNSILERVKTYVRENKSLSIFIAIALFLLISGIWSDGGCPVETETPDAVPTAGE
jgi:hypothetical protein